MISNRNRIGILQSLVSTFKINWMSGCMKPAIGCNENMVAKFYLCPVKNDRIVIGKKIFSDLDVVAVITPKRCDYAKSVFCLTQQLLHKLPLSFFV